MKKFGFILIALLFAFSLSASAQTKRKPRSKTTPPKTTPPKVAEDKIETPAVETPPKKNERADAVPSENTIPPKKNNSRETTKTNQPAPAPMPFVYEFKQPQFQVTSVVIEHDANGKGKITFQKQDLNEPLTDPIEISAARLEKIKNLWNELNFLDSTENYQSPEHDYAHLGTMKLRRQEGERRREAEFNWTENKIARELTDEYKKLTEQFVWIFDMNLSRENQPLNSPQLVDRLESLLNRQMISDPKQMLPFLRQVSDDERLPLIARNHTSKLIQKIEKQKE